MPTCPQCLGAFDEGTATCPNDGATLLGQDPAATLPVAAALALAARRDDATDPLLGVTLAGRYLVRRRIGQGGMGVVYEATHTVIGRSVAVKVLHERYLERPEVAARLMNEARLASSIHNAHIVDIFDFGETADGRTFVVMELLEGESLAQLLRREGPLPERRAVSIGMQVAEALGAAHERGIVHRDVKPENVFLLPRDGGDFVKVLDFGISKAMRAGSEPGTDGEHVRLTHTGMVLGTPLYMSPEQARGEEAIDHRIDVYALGVILYEILAGGVPFRGTNYLGIIAEVLARAAPPLREARPDLPLSASIEQVVARAMAKERGERYATMDELGADLRRVLDGQPVVPSPAQVAVTARARSRRRALFAGIAAIALVVVALAVTLTRRSGGGGPMATASLADPGATPAPNPVAAASSPAPVPVAPAAPAPVEVAFDSRPPGAEVWEGPLLLGRTPFSRAIPRIARPLRLRLVLEGYLESVQDIDRATLKDHDTVSVSLTPLAPEPAALVPARRTSGTRRGGGPVREALPVNRLKLP